MIFTIYNRIIAQAENTVGNVIKYYGSYNDEDGNLAINESEMFD